MKKVWFILLTGMVLLGACQDSVQVDNKWMADATAYYLKPDRTEIAIDNPAGGYATFNIESQGTPWVITEIPDWIRLSATKGNSSTPITVTAAACKESGTRLGTLKLASDTEKWDFSQYITVTQVGSGPYLELDKTYFSFDGKANEELVPVKSNFKWRVLADNNWVHIEQREEDWMVVSVPINDGGGERRGNAFIVAEGNIEMAIIHVYQAVAKASVTEDPLSFDMAGGSCKLTVTSEAPWKVGNSSSWWSVTPNSGDPGTTEVTVVAALNNTPGDRSDRIGFRFAHSGADFATVQISQVGAYLELDETQLRGLSAMGGETHVTLNTNIPWEITEVPDFLTVSPMSGEGTTELTISFSSNQSFDEKNGDLFIGWAGHSARWSYWVWQRSRTPRFETDYGSSYLSTRPVAIMRCDASAQTLTVDLDTDGPWTIVYDRTFFDVTPTSSTGKCTLTITVDENDTEQGREGYFNIRPRGVPSYDDSQPSPWYLLLFQEKHE